jgi:hypothetical protein
VTSYWGSTRPRLSGDGRYVAFDSDASNLVANDANGTYVACSCVTSRPARPSS